MDGSADKYISASCVISKNTVYKNDSQLFEKPDTELSAFLLAAYQHFDLHYPKFYKMDNLCKLGWLGTEVLLHNDFTAGDYAAERVSVVLANANSSLDTDLRYMESVKEIPSPGLFVYTLPNIVIGEICIRHKFKGENAFFIQEYFDAEFLAVTVNNLFDNDLTDRCICGWIDVIGQEYKAALFLIQKDKTSSAIPFSAQQLNTIFENHPE